MSAYAPADWHDLFVAAAGAAAALTGLVFVAVSINIARILEFDGLPERALAALMLLFRVTIVSTLVLVPGQSTTALGAELLGEAIVVLAFVAEMVRRTSAAGPADGNEGAHIASSVLTAAPGLLPFVAGGASLLAGGGGGLYWTLGGVIGALVGGVINAWVLLVEILR